MKNPTKAAVGFSAATVIFSIAAAPFTDSLCHPRDTANDCLNQIQGVVLTASSTSIAADNVIWRTPTAGIAPT